MDIDDEELPECDSSQEKKLKKINQVKKSSTLNLDFLLQDSDYESDYGIIDKLEERPKQFAVDVINQTVSELAGYLNECESPIEDLMAIALMRQHKTFQMITGIDTFFVPQEKIEVGEDTYRVDFFIVCSTNEKHYGFVVECDGHEFHEKTKEQAAKDKSKDRKLLLKGHPVIRFTGSEVWESPMGCAREVFNIIREFIKRHK